VRGATDKTRVNRDINYTRLIQKPETLDIDFRNGAKTNDEEDVLALAANLYGHRTFSRSLSRPSLQDNEAQNAYMTLRSVVAKRNVAQASFSAIVGMKASGTTTARPYMAAIIKELLDNSATDEQANAMIGESPSYYEQLEVLSKKIYQTPAFFVNLYDKPTNVSRKGVAMKAIELMLDREFFESQIRREMLTSVLLSSKLRSHYRDANDKLSTMKAVGE
jgi:hypothetical protein